MAGFYLKPRQTCSDPSGPCDGSREWIVERLRGKHGGIRDGGRVTIARGKGEGDVFIFGEQRDKVKRHGTVMPEAKSCWTGKSCMDMILRGRRKWASSAEY